MTRFDDNGPVLLYSPQGYKCCVCEAILSCNGAVGHIRKKHPFLEENFVLQNRTKDVSKQPLVKVRAYCCQACPMSYESLNQYQRHCKRMGCSQGNIRKTMLRTGTGHLIPLEEDSPSNRKRPINESESQTLPRKNKLPRRIIEQDASIGSAVAVQIPLQSPRKSNMPKEQINQPPRATSNTKPPLRKLSIPVTPTDSPTHDRKVHGTAGSSAGRQLLASVADASPVGEDDPANRQLQSPRGTSKRASLPRELEVLTTGLDGRRRSVSNNQPLSPKSPKISDSAHQLAVTIPNQPSSVPENSVVDQPTSSTKKQPLVVTPVPEVVAVEGKYANDQEDPKAQQCITLQRPPSSISTSLPPVEDNSAHTGEVTPQELQSPAGQPISDSPTPMSCELVVEEESACDIQQNGTVQQIPSTLQLPLEENLSEEVGLRQMIKIFAPDDEIANMITPWVADIFLGKSTDQISIWINDKHEAFRKLSLTPATLDKTTRWIHDCANMDALMIPGDFHVTLSCMNPRDPSDSSDQTLHKMPKDESGLYSELRTLVSFLSPNKDLSLFELITLLCRELLESPNTMNFASHRLFQYVAARMFADESTLRDVCAIDQIASNLLHLFRLAASTYVRRYLFSEYNIFTKQNVNTSNISEGSVQFGRLVRESVFIQVLVPFLLRLREYQGKEGTVSQCLLVGNEVCLIRFLQPRIWKPN